MHRPKLIPVPALFLCCGVRDRQQTSLVFLCWLHTERCWDWSSTPCDTGVLRNPRHQKSADNPVPSTVVLPYFLPGGPVQILPRPMRRLFGLPENFLQRFTYICGELTRRTLSVRRIFRGSFCDDADHCGAVRANTSSVGTACDPSS